MAKQILTLADLGREGSWLLVQQACGIPDARARSTFLENTTTVLFFAEDSLPERLCVTGAVRQMGGHVIYVGPGQWLREVADFPQELTVIASYYVDAVVSYGLPIKSLQATGSRRHPLLNSGSPDGSPLQALADIACMQQYTPDLSAVTMAWVGCANGTLLSLIEATEIFPFTLNVALPPESGPMPDALIKAQAAGRKINVVATPEEAITNANYVCAGCLGSTDASSACWTISKDFMSKAAYKARILLSSSPVCSTPIETELLQSKASLLAKQAENRLRVAKRAMHLLMEDSM